MPDSQQMPGFMKANLGGSQIRACRIFIPEPMKRDYGSLAAKLGFAEHEFKNRCAEVALNYSQLESCSIIDRLEHFDYFSCRILAAQWKVGILRIRVRRQGSSVEANQGLQVCRNDRNGQRIHPSDGNNIYVTFLRPTGSLARQLRLPLSGIKDPW